MDNAFSMKEIQAVKRPKSINCSLITVFFAIAILFFSAFKANAEQIEKKYLFSIPEDATSVHQKINDTGNAIAFWVRRPNGISLLVSGFPPVEYKGHINFGPMNSFQAVTPSGKEDIYSAGETAEKDVWLAWGPHEKLADYLSLDASGKHVAFAIYDHGKWRVVVDFKPEEPFNYVFPPMLSADGGHYVYTAKKDDKFVVVKDGTPGEPYDEIFNDTLFISDDGKHTFYVAKTNDQYHVVWDGKQVSVHEDMGQSEAFSPNGDRYAYSIAKNDTWHVVLDGKESAGYDGVASFVFSPEGSHFAFRAKKNGKWKYVVDGKEGPVFDNTSNILVFSKNGERFAYGAVNGEKWMAVENHKPGSECDGLFGLLFSEDGKHFAQGEFRGDKLQLVLDGKNKWEQTGEPAMRPVFSPDGLNLFYAIRKNSKIHLVVNGKESTPYDGVGMPVFSPDSQHLVYLARRDKTELIVIDDSEMASDYEAIPSHFDFTKWGQLVFWGIKDGKWVLTVNGEAGEAFDKGYLGSESPVSFSPDGSMTYFVLKDNEVYFVSHNPWLYRGYVKYLTDCKTNG